MNIIKLKIDNIGGVEAFKLDANGKHVIIGGPNGAGKSSILNAIAGALGGGRNRKRQKVRSGVKAGSVIVTLGDLTVRWRTCADGKDYLSVENPDGAAYKSPQKMLDNLWGDRTFDPLAFIDADPKEQARILAEVAGIDLEGLNRRRQELYGERTTINRLAKELNAQANDPSYDAPEGTPDEPVDVDAITAELLDATGTNRDNVAARREHMRTVEELESTEVAERGTHKRVREDVVRAEAVAEQAVRAAEQALKIAKKQSTAHVAEVKKRGQVEIKLLIDKKRHITARLVELTERVEKLEDVDTEKLEARLDAARATNHAVGHKLACDKLRAGVQMKKAVSEELTEQIAALDEEKTTALADANLPIDGIGLEDGLVTWQNKALDLLSGSEQLRVSVALGLAQHPEIKVMLIDRWGDLDDEGRKLVIEMADAADCQIWTTVVGERDEDITVTIREGRMVE